jgi:outer membrane protein assembly factor BamE (lipoprotein component of BamABCDE complex)
MKRRRLIGAAALVCLALVGISIGEGSPASGKTRPRVTDRSFAAIHRSMTSDQVQALIGPPQLTSAVYIAPKIVIQCWYYDLTRARHTEFCFDRYRVFHKQRYS